MKEYFVYIMSNKSGTLYTRITDERGHTQPFGRDGRMLTTQGLDELKIVLAPEHVGFVLEKLEALAFQTTFNPRTRTGLVPIHTSLIAKDRFKEALAVIGEAFVAGFCVSEFIAVAH
jgi:repressor of nif and glnA expression